MRKLLDVYSVVNVELTDWSISPFALNCGRVSASFAQAVSVCQRASGRTMDGFLLAESGMSRQEKLAMAIGIYDASRAVSQCRQEAPPWKIDVLFRAGERLQG